VRDRFRARIPLRGKDHQSVSILFDLGEVFSIVDAEVEVAVVTDDNVEVLVGVLFSELFLEILSDIRTGAHESRKGSACLEGDVNQTLAIVAECHAAR
jgi:hypothetical protein